MLLVRILGMVHTLWSLLVEHGCVNVDARMLWYVSVYGNCPGSLPDDSGEMKDTETMYPKARKILLRAQIAQVLSHVNTGIVRNK